MCLCLSNFSGVRVRVCVFVIACCVCVFAFVSFCVKVSV